MTADYAVVYVGAQLAPPERGLDLEWATDAGDATELHEFTVPAEEPGSPLIGVQAFDVDSYGHEIVVNGDPLSGFDVPPADGWQYWLDTITGAELTAGTNTLHLRRDTSTDDAFAVANVVVRWRTDGDGADTSPGGVPPDGGT